uniref:Kelch motif family protein n=1 Tax=Acrobeloides nanus TaxID=290746 RepID=A0A914CWD4_9BILA
MAPCLRSSTKMIATSDFLFIFGGSNPNMSKNSKSALQDVHRFNILTRKWTKLNVDNIPASLICFSTCWNPNPSDTNLVGYIYGGAYDSEGIQMSNELYKFLIDSDGGISFEKVHVENKPSPRCGSAMIMNKTGKLYLIGGADEKGYLCDVWVLDMKMGKLSWKEIKHGCLLKGRYMHEVMLIYDKIFLIAGGDGDWSAPLDKIDVFDIKTQKFIQINTLSDENHGYPHPRQFLSAVIDGTDAYIIGGLAYIKSEQGPASSNMADTKIFSDIWKLSQIIIDGEIFYKWNKMSTSLKMALFFHASAITPEGCVYNFGGCIDAKFMYPSNKLQRFWINPPTLKQISMFKALSNNPSLIEQIQDLRQSLSMKLIRGH